jgi:hypothetical protein
VEVLVQFLVRLEVGTVSLDGLGERGHFGDASMVMAGIRWSKGREVEV